MPELDDMSGLASVSKIIRTEGNLSVALDAITQKATKLLGSHSCVIMVRDDRDNGVRYVSVYNVTSDLVNKRISSEESLGSQVIKIKQPLIINDYSRYSRKVSQLEKYNFKKVMGAPIILGDEAIGSINVHSIEESREYTGKELSVLEILANMASLAISQERMRHMIDDGFNYYRLMHRINDIPYSEGNLEGVLSALIRAVKELVGWSEVAVVVENGFTGMMEFAATKNLTKDEIEKLKIVARETQIRGVAEEYDIIIETVLWKRILSAPLLSYKKQAIGALIIGGLPESFVEIQAHKAGIIQNVVFQVTVAIENYFMNLQKDHNSQYMLNAMNRIRKTATDIMGCIHDKDKVIKTITAAFRDLTCDEVILITAGRGADIIGSTLEISAELSVSLGFLTTSIELEADQEGRLLELTHKEYASEIVGALHAERLYYLPLCGEDRVIGAILLLSKFDLSTAKNDVIRMLADVSAAGLSGSIIFDTQLNKLVDTTNRKNIAELKEAAYDGITDLMLLDLPIQSLVDDIGRRLFGKVAVEDSVGNVLAKSGGDIVADRGVISLYAPDSGRVQGVEPPWEEAEMVPIVAGGSRLGKILYAPSYEKPMDEFEKDVVGYFAKMVGLYMLSKRAVIEAEQRLKCDLFDGILNGTASDEESLYKVGYLGLPAGLRFRILVVEFNDGRDYEYIRRVRDSILAIPFISDKIIYICRRKEAVIIIKDEYAWVYDKINSIILKACHDSFIGISTTKKNILKSKNAYQEAKRAATMGMISGTPGTIIDFEGLGIIAWVFHENNTDMLEGFMRQSIGRLIDHKNSYVLITTLEAYLDCDCNVTETANRLFVHVNTLKYRLNKIKDLTALDISRTEARVNLYLACKFFNMIARSRWDGGNAGDEVRGRVMRLGSAHNQSIGS